MDTSNLTPEQIQLLLSAGEDDPAFAQAQSKQRIADALRGQAMQPNSGQMVGRVFHGGTIADPLARMVQAYGANKMQGSADQLRQEASGRMVQGRQAYGNALANALRRRIPNQTPSVSMTGAEGSLDPQAMEQGGY